MAATTIPGLSTLGVIFSYAIESTAGTKPAAFVTVERCNAIDGISVENEQIDASALEDSLNKYVAGRGDPGGSFNATFNFTNDVETELNTMITAFTGRGTGLSMWVQIYHPSLTDGFFIVVEPATTIPMPAFDQNSLLTIEFPFTIVDYKGPSTAVTPTAP